MFPCRSARSVGVRAQVQNQVQTEPHAASGQTANRGAPLPERRMTPIYLDRPPKPVSEMSDAERWPRRSTRASRGGSGSVWVEQSGDLFLRLRWPARGPQGHKARAQNMSAEERSEVARNAARARRRK